MRAVLAEGYGTFALVFAGTGAIVIDDVSGGVVTHVGVALTFGLIVMAMIYAVGDTSGAHLNPAVTVGFVAAGKLPFSSAARYVVAQIAGALLASLAVRGLFPEHELLGATLPSGSPAQSFWLEVLLTAILMFVILSVAGRERFAGVAVGGTVGLAALFAGPISGASMNPARSLAPALVSGETDLLWIYVLATPLGALVGCFLWKTLQADAT